MRGGRQRWGKRGCVQAHQLTVAVIGVTTLELLAGAKSAETVPSSIRAAAASSDSVCLGAMTIGFLL